MKKKMIISGLILSIISLSCNSQIINDSSVINSLFKDFKKDLEGIKLYEKYFYKEKAKEVGRSKEQVVFYTDSVFKEMKTKIQNKPFEIMLLEKAKEKYISHNFYSSYYNSQKGKIYVCIINNVPSDLNIVYILTYNKKIISLVPTRILDGSIIEWL